MSRKLRLSEIDLASGCGTRYITGKATEFAAPSTGSFYGSESAFYSRQIAGDLFVLVWHTESLYEEES